MENVRIRIAKNDDLDSVCDIVKECWSDIYEGYRKQLGDEIYNAIYNSPLESKAEKIRISVNAGRVFVAECDGVICGFASFSVNGSVGELNNNAVKKSFQGRGIARKLYDAIFERLKEEGCTVAGVSTGLDDAHAAARHAYQKAGFDVSLSAITYYKKL